MLFLLLLTIMKPLYNINSKGAYLEYIESFVPTYIRKHFKFKYGLSSNVYQVCVVLIMITNPYR